MSSVDRSSSSMRISCSRSRTSGLSMAGLRMSPASPPVQHTSTVRTPWSRYLCTVPAPFDASSSGWAWTVSRQSRSAITTTLPSPPRLLGGETAASVVPTGDEEARQRAQDGPRGYGDLYQAGPDQRVVEPVARVGEPGEGEQGDGDDGDDHADGGQTDRQAHAKGDEDRPVPSLLAHGCHPAALTSSAKERWGRAP